MTWNRAGALALALLLAGGSAQARESLRLPWVFSDEPDLAADFGFSPGAAGKTRVHLALGGRFAHFGLPRGAARAPKLAFTVEFKAPSDLEGAVSVLRTDLDLADVLGATATPWAFQGVAVGLALELGWTRPSWTPRWRRGTTTSGYRCRIPGWASRAAAPCT